MTDPNDTKIAPPRCAGGMPLIEIRALTACGIEFPPSVDRGGNPFVGDERCTPATELPSAAFRLVSGRSPGSRAGLMPDADAFPRAEAHSGACRRRTRLPLRGQRRHRTGFPFHPRSRAPET